MELLIGYKNNYIMLLNKTAKSGKRIHVQITNLIVMLQEDFTPQEDIMMSRVGAKKKYQDDIHEMCDKIIMQLALISTFIQTR